MREIINFTFTADGVGLFPCSAVFLIYVIMRVYYRVDKYEKAIIITYFIFIDSQSYILSVARKIANRKRWKIERVLMGRKFIPVKIREEGIPRQFFTIDDSWIKFRMP